MPASSVKDNELIKAAQAGDTAAFDRLVERHRAQIYRLMVRVCHHPDDAEEVAFEAFGRAYEKLEQFEGRSSFVSWLGRISTNLCLRRREKDAVETVSLEDHHDTPHADSPRDYSPENQVLRHEMHCIVRAAVASLPEPDRSVLRLRDIEELSGAETAARLHLSLPAVKARLHRARKTLRERLDLELSNI
jgi:RNA polymerase sigma-70 factor (ECF subfamily)